MNTIQAVTWFFTTTVESWHDNCFCEAVVARVLLSGCLVTATLLFWVCKECLNSQSPDHCMQPSLHAPNLSGEIHSNVLDRNLCVSFAISRCRKYATIPGYWEQGVAPHRHDVVWLPSCSAGSFPISISTSSQVQEVSRSSKEDGVLFGPHAFLLTTPCCVQPHPPVPSM